MPTNGSVGRGIAAAPPTGDGVTGSLTGDRGLGVGLDATGLGVGWLTGDVGRGVAKGLGVDVGPATGDRGS